MFNITAERERRNALAKETRNLLDQNPGATWGADHQTKYDENVAEIERIDASLDRHQKMLDLSAEKSFKDAGGKEREVNGKDGDAIALFDKWTRNGDKGLSDEEQRQIYATMSTTSDAEGGYTVPSTVAGSILDALKA